MSQTSEPTLFDQVAARNFRASDPSTSRIAAASVTAAASQRVALMNAYRRAGAAGLTDEEAASLSGLRLVGYWKRCSDLRRLGCIVATGETRDQDSGRAAMVCRFNKEDNNA